MILRFTAEAEEALFEIGLWIEAQNLVPTFVS